MCFFVLVFDFFQISASVAEIFLRKVKVGARVKSRRWCKYGQRCGVPSEQRFRIRHVQRPHPPRSTALLSIVTTAASNRETERQPDKEAIALMHVVIVTSCELARESLMGVRPCQVKVQSACWHCCCQVCPFSVFSKMPHLLLFSLQFDSTNTTKCRIWTCGFFSPFRETQSSGRLVQS